MSQSNKKIITNEDYWYIWYMSDGLLRNKLFLPASKEYFTFLKSLPPENIVTKRF